MTLSVNIKNASYKGVPVLKNIDFSVDKPSLVAILGRNGAGKSTLLSTICGMVSFVGDISLFGREVRSYKRRELAKLVSAVLQIPRSPHIMVRELVEYGRSPHLSRLSRLSAEDIRIVDESMRSAGISHLADSYADKISGGELRRAHFAMMLAQNTELILLDEATAFMDVDYENKFLLMAKELSLSKTVIAVTHNLDLALRYADKILLLDGGEQIFFGSVADILSGELIEHTFGVKRYLSDGKIFFRP